MIVRSQERVIVFPEQNKIENVKWKKREKKNVSGAFAQRECSYFSHTSPPIVAAPFPTTHP